MLLNLCLLICYCSTGYGLARPDGPARYAKRPTGPCLGWRSGPQAGKARPAGHDVPPRPVRQRAGLARCRAGPGRASPLPRYRDNPRGILSIHEESSLKFENERNNSEHGSYFINTLASPCSYKTSPNQLVSPSLPHLRSPTPSSFLFIKTLKGRLSMHMSIINMADLVELINGFLRTS